MASITSAAAIAAATASLVSTVFTYALKSFLDRYFSRKKEQDKLAINKRVDFLERQLSEFYWPIYIRLQKDKTVWEKILAVREEHDSLERRVGADFDINVVIPDHTEIVDTIIAHIHLAQVEHDDKLSRLLLKYINDVEELKSLRRVGESQKFSLGRSEEGWWHQNLFDEIERRTYRLQDEYNRLLSDEYFTSNRS